MAHTPSDPARILSNEEVAAAVAVLRLRITLEEVEPPVRRLIEVPATATFWDLHVAIQDVMGWQDRHLHVFLVPDGRGNTLEIGIPGPDDANPVIPSRGRRVDRHLVLEGQELAYLYDYGDNWLHKVRLDGIVPLVTGVTYPRCLDGARQCPPEDCGGAPGYADLLAAVADPAHPEHAERLAWCDGAYDPSQFDAGTVVFRGPGKRPRPPRRRR